MESMVLVDAEELARLRADSAVLQELIGIGIVDAEDVDDIRRTVS